MAWSVTRKFSFRPFSTFVSGDAGGAGWGRKSDLLSGVQGAGDTEDYSIVADGDGLCG